jgi:hypothetical protein
MGGDGTKNVYHVSKCKNDKIKGEKIKQIKNPCPFEEVFCSLFAKRIISRS